MIKIKLIAVGKVKEEYFRNAIAEYAKRLGDFPGKLNAGRYRCINTSTPEIRTYLSAEQRRIPYSL